MSDSHLLPTGRFDKILLASDGSEFSRSAEIVALDLARKQGGRLYPMRMVVSNPEFEAIAPELERQRTDEARASLKSIEAEAKQAGVPCTPMVMTGIHPHEEILAASEEIQADCVIMGRRGRRGLARFMVGDATARVVAQASCQVLVVPRAKTLWSRLILVAVDGSRFSDRAAVTAGKLARDAGLPLHVLSVLRDVHSQARRDEARLTVERVVAALTGEGAQVTGETVDGTQPALTIAAVAKERGADLIVGGSHGRSGLERVFLGSVMERLIGLAECCVLATKGG